MPSTNGHGLKRAVLYVRVSTDEQGKSGYSIPDQLRELRSYAAREGYQIVKEVVDDGHSGASPNRPGLQRVMELAEAGSIDFVLATKRDRFFRSRLYRLLWDRDLEELGVGLVALNDTGNRFGDAMQDEFAEWEKEEIAKRTMAGKLEKAREGKVIANHTPRFGFRFSASRDGLEVNEETMAVVRRVFREIGLAGTSVRGVVKALDREGILAPKGGRWNKTMIRHIVTSDVYRPHAVAEIEPLVAPEVAARLDPAKSYGVWWFNTRRTKMQQVPEAGPDGERHYRRRNKSKPKDKSEWIAVPVPDSGIPREWVDAAREALKDNRPASSAGRRF